MAWWTFGSKHPSKIEKCPRSLEQGPILRNWAWQNKKTLSAIFLNYFYIFFIWWRTYQTLSRVLELLLRLFIWDWLLYLPKSLFSFQLLITECLLVVILVGESWDRGDTWDPVSAFKALTPESSGKQVCKANGLSTMY